MIGTLPPIKGISEYCLEQTRSLAKEIEIDFINFKSIYPEFLYPGGSTKEKSKTFLLKPGGNLKIKELLAWYNPFTWLWAGLFAKGKIIHFHWWTYSLFPVFFTILLLSKTRGKKIICTVHNVLGHESNKLDRFLTSLILKFPDYFIVHSKKNKEQIEKNFKINSQKILIIPYGVLNFYKDEPVSKSKARKKLGLDNKDKIILFFGTIRKYKGVDVLIKALSEIKRQIPEAKLVIAGKAWANWKPYQKLISNLKLKENIVLDLNYIPTSKVKYYFTAADLVVLPYTQFESQSGPGNIALAFGKAIIVSNVGGLPDLVKEESIVVEPNDVNQLAQAIIKILKDNNFRKKLEGDSRELAQEYSWDKIAEETTRVYNKLLKI